MQGRDRMGRNQTGGPLGQLSRGGGSPASEADRLGSGHPRHLLGNLGLELILPKSSVEGAGAPCRAHVRMDNNVCRGLGRGGALPSAHTGCR